MPAHKEVEIKFRVSDARKLAADLKSSGFRLVTPRTHEMNTLYDLPDQSLRKRGELLRLRLYGKRWLLTHKAKGLVGRHKSRVETETFVQDGPKIDQILRAIGFQPAFRYEKFRAEWADGTGHVVIDQTPIGNFAEIEGPPRWIDRIARTLGVSRTDYITLSYAPLFFEWKHRTGSAAKEMTFSETRLRPN